MPKGKQNRLSTKIKKRMMIKSMRNSLGIVSSSAKRVGISRETHYVWMRTDHEYKMAIIECIEESIDFAESALFRQIGQGDTTATIFYLKTKGKHRGYVESYYVKSQLPSNDLSNKTTEELLAILDREV